MKKSAGILFFFFIINSSYSQQDSLFNKTLDEVVVTATRTHQQLGNIAVPATVIGKEQIVQSGSVRLTDVLQEQTGLFITSSGGTSQMGGGLFGSGVQIQGLSPDYTLILVNGEPMIGRNGGIINLSRLAVGNIKKIEIVKGPSSSLYGSEAMGGVINIITEKPRQNSLSSSIRYARFNQLDANFNANYRKRNWGIGFFGNTNRSDGYDYDKNTPGKTVDPWNSYTVQINSFYSPSVRTKINFNGKYYNEIQHNYFPVPGSTINISGKGKVKDLSFAPLMTHQFSRKLKSTLRLLFNRYEFSQRLNQEKTNNLYYSDFFQQDYYKAENQTDFQIGKKHTLITGLGFITQRLNTTRYNGIKHSNIVYGFVQDEWNVTGKFMLTGGLRYDGNSDYASAWSPKLAAHYKVSEKIKVRISYGAGFKAPDFRQLYLNFTNMAAGGYTIYGGNEVTLSLLEAQKQNGTVTEILPIAYRLATLKPETSKGFNAGVDVIISKRINLNANIFRNDIDNLIMVDVVAHKSNGTEVYSYFNVKKAFTEGVELQSRFIINQNWQLSGGYQFLLTADKNDLQRIQEGVYTRDYQSGNVSLVTRKEYGGLPYRSKHMANLKLFYTNEKNGWSASLRGMYRSKWGTADKDGDELIDQQNEYANGYLLANISVAKKINDFQFRIGVDNILNYKDTINLPALPGILPYLSITYSMTPKNK